MFFHGQLGDGAGGGGGGSCKSHCNLLESAGYSRVFTKHRLYRFYGHNIVTLFPE